MVHVPVTLALQRWRHCKEDPWCSLAKSVSSRLSDSLQNRWKAIKEDIWHWPLASTHRRNFCLWCRCFSSPGWEEGSRDSRSSRYLCRFTSHISSSTEDPSDTASLHHPSVGLSGAAAASEWVSIQWMTPPVHHAGLGAISWVHCCSFCLDWSSKSPSATWCVQSPRVPEIHETLLLSEYANT